MALHINKYRFIPLDVLDVPMYGDRVITDSYWQVYKDHALIYDGHSYQSNRNKDIAENLLPDGCHLEYRDISFVSNYKARNALSFGELEKFTET